MLSEQHVTVLYGSVVLCRIVLLHCLHVKHQSSRCYMSIFGDFTLSVDAVCRTKFVGWWTWS